MNYIKNEWMKLWSKKGTWAMLIISILLVIIPAIILKAVEEPENTPEARKAANEENLKMYDEILEDEELPEDVKANYTELKMITEYRIEHDLPSENVTTFDLFMNIVLSVSTSFIAIFVVIVAAGIVSQEFGAGTIKMLLTRPVARWKILLSKLLTTIIYGILLYAATIVFSAIIGVILFGTDVSVNLTVVDGVVKEQNPFEDYFKILALSFGKFFMSIFFAFMIGSIFGSSSFAVGITLVITFMSSTIIYLISKYEITKYIWVANDLSQFAPGQMKIIEDLTLPFSIAVNAVYAIIFLAVSFIYFSKRDVTA